MDTFLIRIHFGTVPGCWQGSQNGRNNDRYREDHRFREVICFVMQFNRRSRNIMNAMVSPSTMRAFPLVGAEGRAIT